MVIEGERKRDADDKENSYYRLLAKVGQQQANKINGQDQNFSSDHVGHDGADKKSFFALEDGAASFTLVFDLKREADN